MLFGQKTSTAFSLDPFLAPPSTHSCEHICLTSRLVACSSELRTQDSDIAKSSTRKLNSVIRRLFRTRFQLRQNTELSQVIRTVQYLYQNRSVTLKQLELITDGS
jgi:hypothetical protein